MSEKRASTASGSYAKTEPKGGDALARLSDHLGRLLTHADELLAEWQAHAEGVRARLDVQAREAGAVFQEAVGDALAEAGAVSARELERAFGQSATRLRADLERAQKAAADLDAHMQRLAGGAGPSSVDELRAALAGISSKLDALTRARHGGKGGVPWAVILAGSANVLVVVTIGLVWSRSPDRLAPIPLPPLAAAIASVPDAPPAAAAPSPAAAAPRPCADLAGETTAKVVAECVSRLCGARIEPPVKLAGYAHALTVCKPADASGRDLLAAFQAVERDKLLEKLACAPERDEAGRAVVTVRWLLDCGTEEPAPPPAPPPPARPQPGTPRTR